MKFYEFGEKTAPVILLLPGTCCHWKLNFGEVKAVHAVSQEEKASDVQNRFCLSGADGQHLDPYENSGRRL